MLIREFTGGINTKAAPSLLAINECLECSNANVDTGILESFRAPKPNPDIEPSDEGIYFFKNKFSFHPKASIFTILLGTAFRADGKNSIQKSKDGEKWYNIAIEEPKVMPTIEMGKLNPQAEVPSPKPEDWGELFGNDFIWCYTYFNQNDGTESAPSPYSNKTTIGKFEEAVEGEGGHQARWIASKAIVKNLKASSDPQVTHIKLYRMGAGITNFRLVTTIPNVNGDLTDNVPPSQQNTEIQTIGYKVPPIVNFITSAYGLLLGSKDNILYYSDENLSTIWNPLNYIQFDDNIVGIGVTAAGILVYTLYRVYIIQGYNSLTFSKQLLVDNIGCISPYSIATNTTEVIWQGQDGFYSYGLNGLVNLTYNRLVPTDEVAISNTISNAIYYCVFPERILVINMRLGGIVYYIDIPATSITNALNKPHIIYNNEVCTFDGKSMELTWKSGWLVGSGLTKYKNYKVIYVFSLGTFTGEVYIGNDLVATIEFNQGLTEIKVNQANRTGYYLQLAIKGVGRVFEVEFVAEERQNGR